MKTKRTLALTLILAVWMNMTLTGASAMLEGTAEPVSSAIRIKHTGVCNLLEARSAAEKAWLADVPDGAWATQKPEKIQKRAKPVLRLPPYIEVIGDEAFAGTAIERVEMPETVREVGERAFSDNAALRLVRLPDGALRIAADAFSGSGSVLLTGRAGGFADSWARENGLPFAPERALYAMADRNALLPASTQARSDGQNYEALTVSRRLLSPRPRVTPVREYRAPAFDPCLHHVSEGRAPPAMG